VSHARTAKAPAGDLPVRALDLQMAQKARSRHLLLVLSLVPLFACSSVVSDIDGSGTVTCSVRSGSTEASCVISRGVPSSAQGSVEDDCTKQGGTVVTECPTEGLAGCCSVPQSTDGVTVRIETCAYSGSARDFETRCGGTYTTTP
jgi:hypothetical protein